MGRDGSVPLLPLCQPLCYPLKVDCITRGQVEKKVVNDVSEE